MTAPSDLDSISADSEQRISIQTSKRFWIKKEILSTEVKYVDTLNNIQKVIYAFSNERAHHFADLYFPFAGSANINFPASLRHFFKFARYRQGEFRITFPAPTKGHTAFNC